MKSSASGELHALLSAPLATLGGDELAAFHIELSGLDHPLVKSGIAERLRFGSLLPNLPQLNDVVARSAHA